MQSEMLENKEDDIPSLFRRKLRSFQILMPIFTNNYHTPSKGFSEINCVTTHNIPDQVGCEANWHCGWSLPSKRSEYTVIIAIFNSSCMYSIF